MKFSPISLGGVALALLLSPLASARADLIPWMYEWSRSPTEIYADAPGTGYISLTGEGFKGAVGDSDIVATNLKTYSTATVANPDIFTAKPYSLSLYLYDIDSGQDGTLTFTGQIDGKLTAQSSNLKNTFTGQITQQLVLGDHLYTVKIGPYTPPGVPGSTNSGSISATAAITVETLIPAQLPEPGTLALSGVAVVALGAVRWRARRRERGSA